MGMRIELLRRRLGLLQIELAARVGVTGSNISHWENGRHIPPTEVLPRLAEALGTTPGWLMGEHLADDNQRRQEERLLRLVLDGGDRLDALLDRFESVEALMTYLAAYRPDASH